MNPLAPSLLDTLLDELFSHQQSLTLYDIPSPPIFVFPVTEFGTGRPLYLTSIGSGPHPHLLLKWQLQIMDARDRRSVTGFNMSRTHALAATAVES
jgi:hypothetical protein